MYLRSSMAQVCLSDLGLLLKHWKNLNLMSLIILKLSKNVHIQDPECELSHLLRFELINLCYLYYKGPRLKI